jgi:hypothetical protein
MDCDDEVQLVKRYDDSHANTPDFPRVTRLTFVVPINAHGMGNDLFGIPEAKPMLTRPVLGVS